MNSSKNFSVVAEARLLIARAIKEGEVEISVSGAYKAYMGIITISVNSGQIDWSLIVFGSKSEELLE